jgi:hypothetical protein
MLAMEHQLRGGLHLNDDTDVTTNGHDGVIEGAGVARATGFLGPSMNEGYSQQFGGGGYFAVSDAQSLDFPELTITGWLYITSGAGGTVPMVTRETGLNGNWDFFVGANAGSIVGEVTVTGGIEYNAIGPAPTIGNPQLIAVTVDTSDVTVFVDGAQVGSSSFPSGVVEHDPYPILIGAADTSSGFAYLDGYVDELRLDHTARDANWIQYDYLSQTDAAISYGAVMRAP